MFKRPAISIALALGATLLMATTAVAGSTYTESITGSELPNATPTEGQFVGEATGSFAGTWYIDVRHQDLSHHPAYITGGNFRLNTFINRWPSTIKGSFVPWGGTVSQTSGFWGCTNQRYTVHGALGNVGINGGYGSGSFDATLIHYRTNVWLVGCVVYAASVSGTVSMTF
jgi:hypothetical protein